MKTNNPEILKFFDTVADPKNEIKLKLPTQLNRLLEIIRDCI